MRFAQKVAQMKCTKSLKNMNIFVFSGFVQISVLKVWSFDVRDRKEYDKKDREDRKK